MNSKEFFDKIINLLVDKNSEDYKKFLDLNYNENLYLKIP